MKRIEVDVNPDVVFHEELLCITSPLLRTMAVEALNLAPSYFWVVPASSSGKYHPKTSLGVHGLVRHVKSVFWIAEELLSHRLYAPFTEYEKDLVRVAILLHDTLKQGTEEWGTHTVTEHPLLVRLSIRPDVFIQNTDGAEEDWDTICSLIETHMGIWTTDKKGVQVLKEPETAMQKFVHLCDFLASRKNITVDIHTRKSQNASAPAKDDELATEKQVSYLRSLYLTAHNRGIILPDVVYTDNKGNVVLTKSKAGEYITNAKNKLGM